MDEQDKEQIKKMFYAISARHILQPHTPQPNLYDDPEEFEKMLFVCYDKYIIKKSR